MRSRQKSRTPAQNQPKRRLESYYLMIEGVNARMNIANIKLPIAVIGVIVAQAFGIIWYVAQLDSTVSSNTKALESYEQFDSTDLEEAIAELENRIDGLEKMDAIVENEMRTIMSDHENIGKALDDLGKGSYSDNREYGNYKD